MLTQDASLGRASDWEGPQNAVKNGQTVDAKVAVLHRLAAVATKAAPPLGSKKLRYSALSRDSDVVFLGFSDVVFLGFS